MKTKFKSPLGLTYHRFSRAVCFGAVILICSSAAAQNLFVSARDDSGGKILKFTWDGVQSTRASGLHQPQGLAFDSAGNLFVSDLSTSVTGSVIYKFKPTGVAGSIFASGLDVPIDLAFDKSGNLFVADYGSGHIYKLKPDGGRTIFASLSAPEGLAFDSAGNLFVGETYTGHIYKYTPDGVRSSFASGFVGAIDLAFDRAGNLFVSGRFLGSVSNNVYKFTPDGVRTLFASGMFAPASLAFDYRGNLFVVDLGLTEGPSAIYEFKPNGSRSTFAKGEPSNDPSLEFNHLAFQPIASLPTQTPAPRGE